MAVRWLVATGNISVAANWNGGTLPAVGDILHPNGFFGTVDVDINALEIRNDANAGLGIASGGRFNIYKKTKTIIIGDRFAFSDSLFNFSDVGIDVELIGDNYNINGGNAFASTATINNATIVATGNIYGHTSGVTPTVSFAQGSQDFTLNGSIFGNNAVGLRCQQTNVLITGDVTGNRNNFAIDATTTATATTNTITIQGEVKFSGSATGGQPVIRTNQTAPHTNALVIAANITDDVSGVQAVAARLMMLSLNSIHKKAVKDEVTITPFSATPDTTLDEKDVRRGVWYNFNTREGKCDVPPKEQTGMGVPVDDTVGTAVFTTVIG